jgi:hypothetical protein
MIHNIVVNVLTAATVSALVSALLNFVFKDWLSTRLKASIEHEYNQKLETYKAQLTTEHELAVLKIQTALAREAAFHAAAHASFAEGQKASMERKLNGVDRLWSWIRQFRTGLPEVLTFLDVLTTDEYKAAKDNPAFQKHSSRLTSDNLAAMLTTTIEDVRPYVGEYLWALFFSYRAIMGRILFLLQLARTDADKIEWYKDRGIRHLLNAVLTEQEVQAFDGLEFMKVMWLQERLESKILAATQKIISGETFGAESLEQAELIRQSIAKLPADGQQASPQT